METILGQQTAHFTRLIELQSIGCVKPNQKRK